MIDFVNMTPIQQLGYDRTPLTLKTEQMRFNPLPSGGLVSDAMFDPYKGVDPLQKFNPDAWAARQVETDTWDTVSDLELSLAATTSSYDSFVNLASPVFGGTLFNDPAKGAAIKALYLNRNPLERIKYGDSMLTDQAIKEAQDRLGLLMADEPAGTVIDKANLTENQKKINEVMDFLVYANSRKKAEETRPYSFVDYFAASTRNTKGILGSVGGPWNWLTEAFGEYYGTTEEGMPENTEDLDRMFSRLDPNFDYRAWFEEKTKDPIVLEGLLDNGVTAELIREARNEDQANFFINRQLVKSNIEQRLQKYTNEASGLKEFWGGIVNFGAGMTLAPESIPFAVGTAGFGAVTRLGLSGLGYAASRAFPALMPEVLLGASRATGLAPSTIVGTTRVGSMAAEALVTIPLGMHPAYLSNFNVLARLGASSLGMGAIGAVGDFHNQRVNMAYAAALQYSDPESQLEFDSSRVFSAFGHGVMSGGLLFLGGATVSSTLGAAANRVMGTKKAVSVLGQEFTIRNPMDRRLTFDGTTFGEIRDTFGSIAQKAGTLLDRTPAERTMIDAVRDGVEPTGKDLINNSETQANRAAARATDVAEAAEARPVRPLNSRLDNETRTVYAKRMGAAKLVERGRDFLAELGRRTTADVETKQDFGATTDNIFKMAPQAKARTLVDIKERIQEARAAEAEASGGVLSPEREAVYAGLEKDRAKWLNATLKQLTPLERNAFSGATRLDPVRVRIEKARNEAINAAERSAEADSVAAQLLEAARNNEKPAADLPENVAQVAEAAALENKVMGTISNDTAVAMRESVLGKTPKKTPRINKLMRKAIREIKNNPARRKAIKDIAHNHYRFLKYAVGNKDNAGNYLNTISDLFLKGLITDEQRTILLATALDYDFSGKAFNIKYVIDTQTVDSKFLGKFDQSNNTVTLYAQLLKKVVNSNEHAAIVLLHELGHSMVTNTFGTKQYVKMLRSFNTFMDDSNAMVVGLFRDEQAKKTLVADPVAEITSNYVLSNAEELYVESYAQFSFAANRAAVAEALTPAQQSFLNFVFDKIRETLTKVAYSLEESVYYNEVRGLMEHMTKAESTLKNSVKNVYSDVLNIVKTVDPNNVKGKIVGANSGIEFSLYDQSFLLDTTRSPAQRAAFVMLKAENKQLFTSSGLYTPEISTFLKYYSLQRTATINSILVQVAAKVKSIADFQNLRPEISDADVMTLMREALVIDPNDWLFPATYEQGFTDTPAARGGFDSIADFTSDAVAYQLDRTGKATKATGAISFDDLMALHRKVENDPVLKKSVFDHVREMYIDYGLDKLSSFFDSDILTRFLEDVNMPGGNELIHYSKKAEVPFTAEGLTRALKNVKKSNAADAFGKMMDILDPVLLAAVGKADNEYAAIQQLIAMADGGELSYSPVIGKWTKKSPKPVSVTKKPLPPGTKLADLTPKSTDSIILTVDNFMFHLSSLVNFSSAEGKAVLAKVRPKFKRAKGAKAGDSAFSAEDAIQDTYIKVESKLQEYIKNKIEQGTLKTVSDLRDLFVSIARNRMIDESRAGTSNAGLEPMLTAKKKVLAELQKARETGKDTADLESELLAIEFEISTFQPKKTGQLYVLSTDGKEVNIEGTERVSRPVAASAEETAKDRKRSIGSVIYGFDKLMRQMLGIEEGKNALLSSDEHKLWKYIFDTEPEKAATMGDKELADNSKAILGRALKMQSIQRLRGLSEKKLAEIKEVLKLTPEELSDSVNKETGEILPDSPVASKLRDYVLRAAEPAKAKRVPPTKTPRQTAEAAKEAADASLDHAAMQDTKDAEPVVIPESNPPADTTVGYSLTDENGKQLKPEVMTAKAVDKVINSRRGQKVTKKAVAVADKDVVKTTESGEIVVKPNAEKTEIGSVQVEDPTGVVAVRDNKVVIEKPVEEAPRETDPVKPTKPKTMPKPVDSPVVKEEAHISMERIVNENADTLRENGGDTRMLTLFQKAYWKVMKTVDTGGNKTTATPLFKELFGSFIAINKAIQEANIKKFGQDMVKRFWKNLDEVRAEETMKATNEPGYRRRSDAALYKEAAKRTHPEYLAPALLETDLKIVKQGDSYVLASKTKTPVATPKPEPFPEPKPEEAPKADPSVKPGVAKPIEPQKPETPVDIEESQRIRAAIFDRAGRMSIPLRWSNMVAWIFAGSNSAERSWWRNQMSSLINVIQGPSRLGDTVRSNFAGIRVMAGLLDGTRNVTGMLVAGGKAPILTLLGAKGMESRVILRVIQAQVEANKRFGGNRQAIKKMEKYVWTKMAKGEEITAAGLQTDLNMLPAAAEDILPHINRLVDVAKRTNKLFLDLGKETGLGYTMDADGNPFDPNTWMNIQFDHEKLKNLSPENREALIAAMVEIRKQRKLGDRLDVNTLIVLGWINSSAEGGGATGGLMLRDRKFSHGPRVRSLSPETLARLKAGDTVGGASSATVASLARHGMPENYFVLEENGTVTPYRIPQTRADLAPADLAIYDAAVNGDTSLYTSRWQQALEGRELIRAEMEEMIQFKTKRGRYTETFGNDRPLLKSAQREDVQLAIAGLTPDEILSDKSGIVMDSIRTNLAESYNFFLNGRLSELLFQKELDRFFGQTGITFDKLLNEVNRVENENLVDLAAKEGWSDSRLRAAQDSLKRGLRRMEEEYRANVETLPYVERGFAGNIVTGGLTIARIFTTPGYWLSAGPEVTGALMKTRPTEWPMAVTEGLKYSLGQYRSSKSALLRSGVGDLAMTLELFRTELSNRYLGEQGKGAMEIDSTFDILKNGPRSQYDSKIMQAAEKTATLAEQFGSLAQITNLPRFLAKIEMQRTIYHNLKNNSIFKLIKAMELPENKGLFEKYAMAAAKSAAEERRLFREFAALARKNGFGRDPREAFFYLRYGLNTTERLNHLMWAIEKVGDNEGRVNLIRMMELAEDVKSRPVEGIDPTILSDAVQAYSNAIESEIMKRKTPEPYGLVKVTDTEGRAALGRLIYSLSGWMRAFHDGRIVDYSNKNASKYLAFLGAYAVADITTQMAKEWLTGRDVSDQLEEIEKNPTSVIVRATHALPVFGIGNGLFEDAVAMVTGGSLYRPTVDLSTPGMATVASLATKTNTGLRKAYQAMNEGNLPEMLGYASSVTPIAPIVNKSPLAVPVRILQEAVDLDEKNMVERYLSVLQKDSKPFANRRGVTRGSLGKVGVNVMPAPQRNLGKEREQAAKAEALRVRPVQAPSAGTTSSVSTPLADILDTLKKS